jgi:hypothetical protein
MSRIYDGYNAEEREVMDGLIAEIVDSIISQIVEERKLLGPEGKISEERFIGIERTVLTDWLRSDEMIGRVTDTSSIPDLLEYRTYAQSLLDQDRNALLRDLFRDLFRRRDDKGPGEEWKR